MKSLIAVALLALTSLACEPRFIGAGINEPIVVGGQAEIDAGNVVAYNYGCLPDSPNCTVALAGHNSSNGSVFSFVDDLAIGDKVLITDIKDGELHIHRYRVVGFAFSAPGTSGAGLLYGDLVLQTSMTEGSVKLVYAIEESTIDFK